MHAFCFQRFRMAFAFKNYFDLSSELRQLLEPSLRHTIDLAFVRGASNWFTTLPLNGHDFALHKSTFQHSSAIFPPSHCHCKRTKCQQN